MDSPCAPSAALLPAALPAMWDKRQQPGTDTRINLLFQAIISLKGETPEKLYLYNP